MKSRPIEVDEKNKDLEIWEIDLKIIGGTTKGIINN
jgi:hypothetical protein